MGTLKNPPVVAETEVDRPSSSDVAVTAPESYQGSREWNICSHPYEQITCQDTKTQGCPADIPEFDNLGPKLIIDYSGEQSQDIESLDELARLSRSNVNDELSTEAA